MPGWLLALFSQYGYAVIAIAVLLENAGVPAPGHTALLAGGFLAHMHQLSLPWVVAIGTVAAIAGDNLGYWIGRRGGRPLLRRHGRLLRLTPARLARIDAFFVEHGAKTVFVARFVTGLQTVAALFAGASEMPWRRFLAFNVLGAIAWAIAYAALGYVFGHSWELLEHVVGRAGVVILALGAVAAFAMWSLRRRATVGRS